MRTYLITGATAGIGLECAVQLASRDTRLVLVGRNDEKLQRAKNRVSEAGAGIVNTLMCDFASLDSVRTLAKQVMTDCDRIDVLINNAGTVFASRSETIDGYESTFAVNHLASYLLTESLKPLMIASAPSRIVITASDGHYQGSMDFNDLGFARNYSVMKAYSRSKLANVLYTRDLARELADSGVTVNALHPGMVATDIWDGAPWFVRPLLRVVKPLIMISPEEGGSRIAYLASDPTVANTTGAYFQKNRVAQPSALARDDKVAARLRQESDRLTALRGGPDS